MDETNMSAADSVLLQPICLVVSKETIIFSHASLFLFSSATKVVASKYEKKQQINKLDNRGTITIAHCGLASDADGPHFFLVKA
jgi:hypothetical protein